MQFAVLGPVEVLAPDGRVTVALTSPNQATILAVLLAHAPAAVSAATLIDAVWGDGAPPSALASLRTYVSRLRAVVGDRVVTRGDGWALGVQGDEIDAGVFEQALASDDPDRIAAGLALWRGPAYAGHSDHSAVRAEAARLEQRRRYARGRHAQLLMGCGRLDEALANAERLVVEEPLDEGTWQVLIRALAAAGRNADALRAFQRAAAVLADAGLAPSPELREAERAAFHDGAAEAGRASSTVRPAPRAPLSSLVGRDSDLAAVSELLTDRPLVTVVGPGGVGKTRLALELARRLGGRHALGSRVIELSRLAEQDALADAVLDGMGVIASGRDAADAFADLHEADLLVVLDNCEHVLDDAAALVARVLRPGSSMRILATSRERLGIPGEQVWRLDPLDLAPLGAADQLFCDRAGAVMSGGTDSLSGDVVQRVVRRLDGLPLAIEMAAARLDTMTCTELAELLERELDSLRAGWRGADPRHRTLASAVEWSEGRLSDDERAVFAGFSVFAGPVDAREIAGVLGDDAVEVVRALASRSLVAVDLSGERARYRMLETVKALASDRLHASGRALAVGRCHASHFLHVAQGAAALLATVDEIAGHERLSGCFGELRAAHRWSRAAEPALALELTRAVQWWAYTRLRDECFGWAEAARNDSPEGTVDVALLTAGAIRASFSGRLHQAVADSEAVLSRAPAGVDALVALTALADTLTYLGRLDEAAVRCQELIAAARRLGSEHYEVIGVVNLALAKVYGGHREEGLGIVAPWEDRAETPSDRALVHYTLGEAVGDSDPLRALGHFDRAIELADAVGSRFIAGVARVSSVSMRARHADPRDAIVAFAGVIDHWRQTGANIHQQTTLRNLPTLLQRIGAPSDCATILGAVERPDLQPTYGEEAERLAGAKEWARRELGEDAFAATYRRGAALSLPQAAATAIAMLE